jgi:hypothetical protein
MLNFYEIDAPLHYLGATIFFDILKLHGLITLPVPSLINHYYLKRVGICIGNHSLALLDEIQAQTVNKSQAQSTEINSLRVNY